jgi:hypothetical protein
LNNCFCFVCERRREERKMVLFCQSGQHFCNSLYVHGTGLEETKEYAGRRLIHNCQLWQAAAVSAATPPLFRPQTVGMFYLLILILIFFLFF